jgi:hypothetical protein
LGVAGLSRRNALYAMMASLTCPAWRWAWATLNSRAASPDSL